MGRDYVVKNFGDNCFYQDSTRKQYWRATGRNDIMVFNNYYGNTCGYGCGPQISSFKGGFGFGIGLGLSQWFMGGLNTMAGWFNGGGPWGNMGLFGGNSSPFAGNWWNNSGSKSAGDCDCNCCSTSGSRKGLKSRQKQDDDDKKVDPKKDIEKKLNDIDNPKFKTITKQILDAIKDGKFEEKEYEDIKNALNKALGGTDKNHEADDKANYNNLVGIIDELKTRMNPNNAGKVTPEEVATILAKEDLSDDDISTLLKDLKATEPAITNEQKEALKTKITGALNNYKKDNGAYKVPTTYSDLLKMELLCKLDPTISVDVINRDASSDSWIAGSIKNVTKNAAGNIEYDVDCTTQENASKKGTYHIQHQDATGTKAKIKTVGNFTTTITWDPNIEYEWDIEKGCFLNKTSGATIK